MPREGEHDPRAWMTGGRLMSEKIAESMVFEMEHGTASWVRGTTMISMDWEPGLRFRGVLVFEREWTLAQSLATDEIERRNRERADRLAENDALQRLAPENVRRAELTLGRAKAHRLIRERVERFYQEATMATDKQANVRDHGIFAEHDMLCAIRGCENTAVLDMTTGVYQPCWTCQRDWLLTPRKVPWWRKLFRKPEGPRARLVKENA